MSLRRSLYAAARLLGDVDAARKGPAALGRRLVRKQIYKRQFRLTSHILRKFGLK